MIMEKKLFTVTETAHLLSIGRNRVYELIRTGELRALELNGLKIRDTAIENFLNNLEN